MKKKLFTMAMAVALIAVSIVGMSLAYFTDTDKETNVFTTGNVEIDLTENFTQNSKLLPGSNTVNNVKKEVFVTNTGSEDAYVRVHLAIPSILDDAQPNFDASKNVLHFNNDNMATGQWNWSTSLDRPDGEYTKDGNWNFYTTTIDGIAYNVYVVTYETALKKGDKTPAAMNQVYLDSKTSQEDIAKINEVLGANWKFYVFAEGVQAEGFADAYAAFAAAGLSTPDFA